MSFDNSFNIGSINAAGAPMRLRLTHSRGEARDGVLLVSASGSGMAEALELGGERLNDAQWRAANMCRITWQSSAKRWQLSNGSPTLVCALNGERVTRRQPIPIAPGDVLELGLHRFVMEAGGAATPLAPRGGPFADLVHPRAAARSPAASFEFGASEEDAFDLRDLALPTGNHRWAGVLDDPFGVLEISGAEARPIADPLSELLCEAPPLPPVQSAASRTALLQGIPRKADRIQEGRASAVTQRAPVPGPVSANIAETLFDELRAEFVRVVRDPTQLAGRTDWEGFLAPGGERAPTWEELGQASEPFPLLRDILRPRKGIDQVIESFDPLGHSSLLDEHAPDDVLRLFAPELARNAKPLVPSLTRREHHELSPDSHMRLGSSRVNASSDDKDGLDDEQ